MNGRLARAVLVPAAIGALALAGVLAWTGPEALAGLGGARPGPLAAAVATLAASFLLAGVRLRMLVRRAGERLALRHAVRAHVVGLFASAVTPGGSGGMPAVSLTLQRQGVSPSLAWASGIATVTADLAFFGWSTPLALLVLARGGHLAGRPWLGAAAAGLSAAALALAWLLAFRGGALARLARGLLRGPARRFRAPALRFAGELEAANRIVAAAGPGWHLAFHAVVAASWWALFAVLAWCARGFGAEVPLAPLLAALTLVSGIGSLVPTPGGSGAFELGGSLALLVAGPQPGVASAVLVWRLLTFYALFPVGLAAGGSLLLRDGSLSRDRPPGGPSSGPAAAPGGGRRNRSA